MKRGLINNINSGVEKRYKHIINLNRELTNEKETISKSKSIKKTIQQQESKNTHKKQTTKYKPEGRNTIIN